MRGLVLVRVKIGDRTEVEGREGDDVAGVVDVRVGEPPGVGFSEVRVSVGVIDGVGTKLGDDGEWVVPDFTGEGGVPGGLIGGVDVAGSSAMGEGGCAQLSGTVSVGVSRVGDCI